MAREEISRTRRPGTMGRAALAAGGGALLFAAARFRGPARTAAALGGGALLAAGLAQGEGVRRLAGMATRAAPTRPQMVRHAITIGAPRSEVYRLLRDPERLAPLIPGVRRIEEVAPERWRWQAEGPGGALLAWDTEFEQVEPDRGFAWYASGDIDHCGVIELREAPGGRGTEVTATLSYQAPFGRTGAAAARWASGREPGRQTMEMLRHLKMALEVGEIATVAGQSHGRRSARWTESE